MVQVNSPESLNESVHQFYQWLVVDPPLTKEKLAMGYDSFVDVRDVALAHVLALETVKAGGERFITSNGSFTIQDICEYIFLSTAPFTFQLQ